MTKSIGHLMPVESFAAELDSVVERALDSFRGDVTDEDLVYIHARLIAWRAGQLKTRIDEERHPGFVYRYVNDA